MDVVALLLAAGTSERMGTPKALLTWEGQPLLSHQLQQIQRSRITQCVVVLGHDADRLAPLVQAPPMRPAWKARAVRHPQYLEGKVSSIRAGLTALVERPDGVMIAAVDQPLDHRLVDALLLAAEEEWEKSEAAGRKTIVLPAFEGRFGHPPLFNGSLMGELMGISEAGQGLKAVVRRRPERVRAVAWDSDDVLVNLNEPIDVTSHDLRRGTRAVQEL
jgi:molybdenum cofactor cytidylyltransferase